MTYTQLSNTGNDVFLNAWVERTLEYCRGDYRNFEPQLLDVGAGLCPYRQMAIGMGYQYRSQDFSRYSPNHTTPGIHNAEWSYPRYDFECDITQIPLAATSDVILCTEVLEHVPDPVRAFERMAQVLRPGGRIVVTVPMISLMHQAPYWFQSGLSPFWFEYWAERNSLVIEELTVYGDYVDMMSQEVGRLLVFKRRIKGLNRVGMMLVKRMRPLLSKAVLEAGGFGCLFVGRKTP